jgi:Mrp family chromosome partitioning ATPase
VRVLGEIPAQPDPASRTGTLRRRDLVAFDGLLAELRDTHVVAITGDPARRRQAAAGLATAAAAGGTRTALVECDLDNPTMAESLGIAIAPGLGEYLRGEADAGRILKPVTLAGPGSATAREPLVCVVAGRRTQSGPALLESERFRHAVAKLRSGYERVVLEGPPASGSDGALVAVAAEADATLACVGRSDPVPDLPVPLTGLIVEG